MIRHFRWIQINCFNRFRFLAEVSINFQKSTLLGNLRTITQERKKKLDKWTHFFIYFLSCNCLWYSFLYLKNAKIHFHDITTSVLSGLQNTRILEDSGWRFLIKQKLLISGEKILMSSELNDSVTWFIYF